jgi:hypothetical protein
VNEKKHKARNFKRMKLKGYARMKKNKRGLTTYKKAREYFLGSQD